MVKHKDQREEDELDEDDREEDELDEDGGDEKDDSVEVDDEKDDKKGKEKNAADDIEIVEDERIVAGQERRAARQEETTEEKRERRRKEKQQKREKRLSAERRDKQLIQQQARELSELKNKMAQVESLVPQFQQRMASQEELQIDNALDQQKNIYNAALTQLNKAITEGNGAAAAEAQRYLDDAKIKHGQLVNLKQNVSRQRTDTTQEEEAPQRTQKSQGFQETEMFKIYRNRWTSENDWFDPKSDDEDSVVAKAIDKKLIREGYDPNEKDFWTELGLRLREELPHLYEEKEKTRTTRQQPRARQTNGSQGHDSYTASTGKTKIPARVVQMAKDAGQWDDPIKQKLFIRNWKLQNGANNG